MEVAGNSLSIPANQSQAVLFKRQKAQVEAVAANILQGVQETPKPAARGPGQTGQTLNVAA